MSSYPDEWSEIAVRVRREADYRCVRCGHPDPPGNPKRGRRPCDEKCRHPGAEPGERPEKQRILTVHHLDGDKSNCRWWNLPALCQVCHLTIQGKVAMEQTYTEPHSEWFWPYVAGYYAFAIGGEDLTREEVEARLPELLSLGQPWLREHYRKVAA